MLSSKPRMHSERATLSPLYFRHSGPSTALRMDSSRLLNLYPTRTWMPACAGMTSVTLSDGEKILPYLRKH